MPLATSTFNPAGDFVAREPMQYQADPLSDATMAAVIGPWASTVAVASAAYLIAMHASQWLAIKEANALRATWTSKATIHSWHVPEAIAQDHIKLAFAAYLRDGKTLPDWADHAKIARAEALFMEYGALSCLLLFCELSGMLCGARSRRAAARRGAIGAAHRVPNSLDCGDDFSGDDARRFDRSGGCGRVAST